jgi:Chromate transporter
VSFVLYFFKLGTIGFGGPVALVGLMHRDLVARRRLVAEDTYRLALAFAQIMPGPLAAQCAIALGYFEQGVLGATLVGIAFVWRSAEQSARFDAARHAHLRQRLTWGTGIVLVIALALEHSGVVVYYRPDLCDQGCLTQGMDQPDVQRILAFYREHADHGPEDAL